LVEILSLDLDCTIEIVRGFNLQFLYRAQKQNGLNLEHSGRIGIRFGEFR
jgi:hypothetical protein